MFVFQVYKRIQRLCVILRPQPRRIFINGLLPVSIFRAHACLHILEIDTYAESCR